MTNEKYLVKIMPTAITELKEAVRYIAKDNPLNAQRFAMEVRTKINKSLVNNPTVFKGPHQYPLLIAAGYRKISCHTNYTALYVIIGQVVEVHHIIHNKRNWTLIVGGNKE